MMVYSAGGLTHLGAATQPASVSAAFGFGKCVAAKMNYTHTVLSLIHEK